MPSPMPFVPKLSQWRFFLGVLIAEKGLDSRMDVGLIEVSDSKEDDLWDKMLESNLLWFGFWDIWNPPENFNVENEEQ